MTDEELRQALAELQDVVRCRCHEAYTGRGLHDPQCECDSQDALNTVVSRIEALTTIRDTMGNLWAKEAAERNVLAGRCEDLEAKLAKAVEALHEAWFMLTVPILNYQPEPEEPGLRRIKDTLAELTGGKDE